MFRTPSSRRKVKKDHKLNLIPILDSVFIFIFFLLMSVNFIQIFEINSDVPIISDSPPPKNQKKPLALTLQINRTSLVLSAGVPSQIIKRVGKNSEGKYDLIALHDFLVNLKQKHIDEESIIFEPTVDLEYEELINIMDSVRLLKDTDETLFKKNKEGLDEKLKTLFNNIIFGNIMS